MRKIRVLVVEDSLLFQEMLVKGLGSDPEIEIVAAAKDPYEAQEAIVKYKPDVMTLDIELPKMNGIEFLKTLMPKYPMPVVVVSTLSDRVFDALNAGAVDFVSKPSGVGRAQTEAFIKNDLLSKVKVASVARIGLRRNISQLRAVPPLIPKAGNRDLIVAIGASTGGTEATSALLKEFGTDIPGTVIVQHMPAGFTAMYAKRLNDLCRVRVKEAQNGDVVMPGQVLIAPGGTSHMKVVKRAGGYQVMLQAAPKVNGHCPSVDVLFDSVAEAAGSKALGIILTGMGGDGAKGLLAMRKKGARTIGQDESTCVVYGMPKVAYDMGAVEYQEKLPDIARRTYSLLGKM